LGDGRQVVMAGENFTYRSPHARIGFQESTYMFIRILVVGIETGQKRMKTLTLLRIQLLQGMGNNMIGGAIPIGTSIVTGIVARPAGLVLMPFLGYRNTADHHMADVMGIHLLEQLVHALAFLDEGHV